MINLHDWLKRLGRSKKEGFTVVDFLTNGSEVRGTICTIFQSSARTFVKTVGATGFELLTSAQPGSSLYET